MMVFISSKLPQPEGHDVPLAGTLHMVFMYNDCGFSVTHLGDSKERQPVCGTGYGIDNGEFLYSDRSYDVSIMREYGILEVDCKRCLKKLYPVR